MHTLNRDEVRQKMDNESVHILEVLGPAEFNDFHLPNAINIPLKDQHFDAKVYTEIPNKDDEIIVYCKDRDCNASTEAAKRLLTMGYTNVYEYSGGKEDWKSAGLPTQ